MQLQPSASSVTNKDLNGIHRNGSQPRGTVANGDNAGLLQDYYEQWLVDPSSVDAAWRAFFEGFELGCQQLPARGKSTAAVSAAPAGSEAERQYRLKQASIYNLLFAYRTLGHHLAHLDPLEIAKPIETELDLKYFKLDESDLDTVFDSGKLAGGGDRTLREILAILKQTYCGPMGAEFMHIQNFGIRSWMRDTMEMCQNIPNFSSQKKRRVLNRVLAAEMFEKFLHTRYVGQKRFGLEGGESLIPMLDAAIEKAPAFGVQRFVIGMAHRGRLNVLANIMNMSYKSLFDKFADNYYPDSVQGDGDVKYHLGYDATLTTSGGQKVDVSLAPNPSHLEVVNPVVEGKARAWQRILGDTEERKKVVPILIHGDAAFIGQGIVQETINMSQLPGYRTGGTIHIVINNQIGFTTIPSDARSSIYCTSIGKMNGIPILHVNGDFPNHAVYCMELALEYRQRFSRDIILDLSCYRRHGHNEGDEPNFTQPTMYQTIDEHPLISELLIPRLTSNGDITQERADTYVQRFNDLLNNALTESRNTVKSFAPKIKPSLATPSLQQPVNTKVAAGDLKRIGLSITEPPKNLNLNPKILKMLEHRRSMIDGKSLLDWSTAESLAFGTLLDQGIPVRLSGQDCRRGTFSQRHAVVYDVHTRERYIPLHNISPKQAEFNVYNSPLSENGILGFEFGYTLDFPQMLCMWEAQFGDFANGAQTVIDQYIVSSESKWGVNSRLVLLLPHGMEGQGPDHSSARLERFLQACAEDNIQVANLTTPANYFHILRRQMLRDTLKPLVIMTPKKLLRLKECGSSMEDLANGEFQEVISDANSDSKSAKRLILCSGKVFYDLDAYRQKEGIKDAHIIRIEQLYPWHIKKLEAVRDAYKHVKQVVWCQEESHNMGAWSYVEPRLRALFGCDIAYAGREASASTATGAISIHNLEQAELVQQAFKI
ncbi:MAG: 2-oxoglutarate dehydrogenase E1 component [Verrucomicrobiales bacterium]|jgi:2-oxoglutarate dehydrogenase E1 component|nr:2-oxoglutarate dehydrogenase E1 component [Verrucomicrobiales bacterium]